MTDPRPALIPIDRIVSLLTDGAESLVRELLPLGHRDGHEWREARKSQGGLGDSLSVHLGGGARRGVWAVHGGSRDESGDLLDLIAYTRFNGDKKAAIMWAKAWLGLDGPDALRLATQAPVRAKVDDTQALAEAQQRRAAAQAIYLAGASITGTPVARYLASRGLDVSRLPYPLNALRCHGGLWDRHTKRRWPAMVAAITGADGKFLAVHQTYLEVLSDGSVRKAPIVDEDGAPAVKRVLGSFRGGTIRLWRGTRCDPETGEIKQARRLAQCKSGEWVDITEGIEDGLTVALADQSARVLVAVSISNMASIVLPPCVEGVMLWRQNDAPGSKAEAAFERAVKRFTELGKKTAIWQPPAGIKDVNELAQMGANGVRVAEGKASC